MPSKLLPTTSVPPGLEAPSTPLVPVSDWAVLMVSLGSMSKLALRVTVRLYLTPGSPVTST